MSHILDLSPALVTWLNRSSLGTYLPKVIFSGNAKYQTGTTAGGDPIFSATAGRVNWDLSDFIGPNSISLSQSKPIIPGDGINSNFTASQCTVSLMNDGNKPWIGTTQDGAIMDLSTIEEGELKIECGFSGISDRIAMFTGRVQGPPTEEEQKTTFVIYDLTYENVTRAVHFDNFGEVAGLGADQQQSSGGFGGLTNNFYTLTSTRDNFKAYSGSVTFDEVGNMVSTITNNNPDQIDLLSIIVKNGAKPGLYSLRFESPTGFRLTFPDNQEYRGNISQGFDNGLIQIPVNSWIGIDGTGVEITWQVMCCNWSGCFGTMIMVLLERMFLQNYGEPLGTNPQAAGLPVNWQSFRDFERQYKAFRGSVSETNKDTGVWELRSGNRPLTYIKLIQRIADHCMANIIIQADGMIAIQGPRIFDDLKTLSTSDWIRQGFKLKPPKGGVKYNIIQLKYAQNGRSGNFGVTDETDLRSTTQAQPVILSRSFPYYKKGVSANIIAWIAELLERRYVDNPNTFTVPVTSNFSLVAMPGDRFKLISNVQPKGSWNADVYGVSGKSPGGDGSLNCFALQIPEGPEWILCDSEIGEPVI